ncbi:MAG TPA: hypothetical protein VFS43_42315 [Polyangiaceae bacterium]|nr:hypothetical protein [Polyangiaceae bacterium]
MADPFVRGSDDVATVPERFARLDRGSLAPREAPPTVPGFTLAAAWHERARGDPAFAWPRDRVATHARPRRPRRVS